MAKYAFPETIGLESSFLWAWETSVVYIKTNPENPTFVMREITIGYFIIDGYVVLSGLEKVEEIVTNGAFTVDAAAQLKGKKIHDERKSQKSNDRT